jgi:preprotein translocase subunit SecE
LKTEQKKSFVSQIPQFIDEVHQERRKVTWPSRRETLLTTAVVFVFSVIASIYFLIVDKSIVAVLDFIKGL